MNKKLLAGVCVLLVVVGGAFIGAGSNEDMTNLDTLWLILGIASLVASLGLYGWFTRDEPLTRNIHAIWGAVMLLVGLVLTTALSGFWTVIGLIDIGAGFGLLFKADKDEKARKAHLSAALS